MIIGIDKGSSYTKTDKGLCIRSTVKKYEDDILKENSFIEIDNKKYVVGEEGSFATNLMKSEQDNTKILVLSVIAMSVEEFAEVSIVLGLPIGQYSKQKQNMKRLFSTWTNYKIKVNDKKKYIKIKDIEVFPEGAGAFYSQDDYKSGLVVDVGGLSIDTALFENSKLKKYSTYSMGIMKLYSKIANRINAEHDLSYTEWDIPGVLKSGLYIFGKQVELNIQDLVKKHTDEILTRLELEYNIKALKVLLTGGGSILLEENIKNRIPQAIILDDPQFNNAKGFYNVGRKLFV